MEYDIDARIVFDSYHKNAEIMLSIYQVNCDIIPIESKILYGGNFIVCPAKDYNDAEIKLKSIHEEFNKIIKDSQVGLNSTTIKELISLLKQKVKIYKKAQE